MENHKPNFKVGDIVTGIPSMRKHSGYTSIFRVINTDPGTYIERVMRVEALTPCDYYESLQFQHHFEYANEAARILYGKT